MLHNDEISLVLKWHTEVGKECVGGFTHHHCAKELASEPSATAWRDGRLDDSDFQVGACLAEHVRGAETAGSGTHDHDVGFGVGVEVVEVATGHGARDLGFTDWGEGEALVPFVGQLSKSLGLVGVDRDGLDVESGFQGDAIEGSGGLDVHGGWWRHVCGWFNGSVIYLEVVRVVLVGRGRHDPFAGIIHIKFI